MNNEVQKFDPSTLMQGVKDRIKATFVSLIPDDQWDNLVQREIDSFFAVPENDVTISFKKDNSGYSTEKYSMELKGKMSPFRLIVWEMCMTEATAHIKKQLTEFMVKGNVWNIDENSATKELTNIIAQAAPLAWTRMFQSMGMQIAQDIKNQIQNFR